ncbi:MAG: hypothetical protein OEY86_20155 [Nitrospira sp.]|nr:hypothetical protein [Nitrospira sp.]
MNESVIKKLISVRVWQRQWRELKQISRREGRHLSESIRCAIDEFIEKRRTP